MSTIRPESTIPKPPPTPQTAESRPIPTLTFSGGNSSRMIAKLSGKSAPPAPETTRKAISDQRFQANAAPRQPARKRPRLISSSRSFLGDDLSGGIQLPLVMVAKTHQPAGGAEELLIALEQLLEVFLFVWTVKDSIGEQALGCRDHTLFSDKEIIARHHSAIFSR